MRERSLNLLGIKRKRDHVGIETNYTWSQQEWFQEIKNFVRSQQIIYSDLAQRYNLKNKARTWKCYLNARTFMTEHLCNQVHKKQRIYQIYFCVF